MSDLRKIIFLLVNYKEFLIKLFVVLLVITTIISLYSSRTYHGNIELYFKDLPASPNRSKTIHLISNKTDEIKVKVNDIIKSKTFKNELVVQLLYLSGNQSPTKEEINDLKRTLKLKNLRFKTAGTDKLFFEHVNQSLCHDVLVQSIKVLNDTLVTLNMAFLNEPIMELSSSNIVRTKNYIQLIIDYLKLVIFISIICATVYCN